MATDITDGMELESYFEQARVAGASDVHLIAGEPPMLRRDGMLGPIDDAPPLTADALTAFLGAVLSDVQRDQFAAKHEVDLARELGGARFRLNAHWQRGLPAVTARLIPPTVPAPEDIRLDESILHFSDLLNGLVLVTGAAGSGKSTTLAVIVDRINRTRPAHIITIEDPIEFMYARQQAVIEQRELGIDTLSFAEALRAALRQDPNVILLGEMRDRDSVEAALTAAETGHLVLSTLHTPSAPEAIIRIVSLFPAEQQSRVLVQLAGVLRGVVSQRLLPSAKGGRIAAREILLVNTAVANHIREQKIPQLISVMQTSRQDGMRTMEQALQELATEGIIDPSIIPYQVG